MSWFITNLVSAFLLPPLNILVLVIIGLIFLRKHPVISRTVLTSSFILLWLFSTPYFAETLLHKLEGEPRVLDTSVPLAEAIVVLGGGSYFHAPEYGGDTVSDSSLLRLRYAAKLYRKTGKPILVTGGKPVGNAISEAQQLKQVLTEEFGVPVKWMENTAENTLESAKLSWQILQQNKIKRIYLVTHAWHIPRALQTFQAVGFEVIPAPTAYTTHYQLDLLAFIPNAEALRDTRIFLHEIIGIGWYRLRLNLTAFF